MHIDRAPRPAVPVVSLAEAKLHLRIDHTDDDDALAWMIEAATEAFEAAAQVALITRQIRVTLDRWPGPRWLHLPVSPLIDPDTLSVVTAWDAPFQGFEVLPGLRPVLRLTDPAPAGALLITYDAGFGASAADVPHDCTAAILDQLIPLYDARGLDQSKGSGLSAHMARVVARYRRVAL